MKYRAGLIGAGHISRYHVAALRRAGVEIVGLCDIDAARAKVTAEAVGAKAFTSPAELAAAGANVLHVLTPPDTHCQVALEALALGCHLLVEKPLAVDVEECRRIESMAVEKGLRVCVNHSLLYDPQVRRALGAVRSGKLSRVISVDILRSSAYPPYGGGLLPPQSRSAGYPFRDLGVHALYLLETFLGPIEAVQADWKSLGGDPNLVFDEWRAQVQCRDGIGQFQLSWNVRPLQSQIIVQGTKGVLRADLFLMFQALRSATRLPNAAERVVNALADSLQPLVDLPCSIWGVLRKKMLPYHGLQDLVKEFYRTLSDHEPVPVSVKDATRIVKWTEHVARAAEADYAARVARISGLTGAPILVTGASGRLGSAVVERLRSQGSRVRMLVRRLPDDVPDGVEVALGNLGDPAAVDRAVQGVGVVIHAGAAMKGGWTDHECATIRGTQNVLDACRKHGVRNLVYISSMSVVDWAQGAPHCPIDENTPVEPRPMERGFYTRAKLEAEMLVRRASEQYALRIVTLRPGQIYGRAMPLLTPAVARRVGRRWLVLGDGTVRLPLVHIDDVVDAILSAAKSTLDASQVVQLVGAETPTQNELLERALSQDASIVRIPRWLVFAAGKCIETMFRLMGRQSPFGVYRLKSALARRTFRSVAAPLLGWSPRVGVWEEIHRTQECAAPQTAATNPVEPDEAFSNRKAGTDDALAR